MTIFEGTIITCDEKDSVAKFLVEDEGKILFVGDELPPQFSKDERVYLEKKTLIPSFSLPFFNVQFSKEISISETVKSVQTKIEKLTSEGFLFYGIDVENESISNIKSIQENPLVKIYTPFSVEKNKIKFLSKEPEKNINKIRLDIDLDELAKIDLSTIKDNREVIIRTKNSEQIKNAITEIVKSNTSTKFTIIFSSEIDINDIYLCKKYGISLCLEIDKNFASQNDSQINVGQIVRSGVDFSMNYMAEKNPFSIIEKFANASSPETRVSVYELLRSMTYNATKLCSEENMRGSLEVDKKADMLMLSQSPYSVDKNKLEDIKIETVFADGKIYKNEGTKKTKFEKIKRIVYNKR